MINLFKHSIIDIPHHIKALGLLKKEAISQAKQVDKNLRVNGYALDKAFLKDK